MLPNIQSHSQFRNHIQNLKIGYSTAHDVGVVWGARLLEPAWSAFFGQASRPWNNDAYPKFMVLLSDGVSVPIGYDFGDYPNHSETSIANTTKQLCQDLKSKGVTIYGISYYRTSSPQGVQLIEDCASPGLHFKANNVNVKAVFIKLANDIKLRGVRISG